MIVIREPAESPVVSDTAGWCIIPFSVVVRAVYLREKLASCAACRNTGTRRTRRTGRTGGPIFAVLSRLALRTFGPLRPNLALRPRSSDGPRRSVFSISSRRTLRANVASVPLRAFWAGRTDGAGRPRGTCWPGSPWRSIFTVCARRPLWANLSRLARRSLGSLWPFERSYPLRLCTDKTQLHGNLISRVTLGARWPSRVSGRSLRPLGSRRSRRPLNSNLSHLGLL